MIRLDDVTAGLAWELRDPVATGRAEVLDQVTSAVRQAEARAREHREWVVLVVAYEAAPAFDAALRTAPSPPPGTPFVWWASFGRRTDVAPPPRGPGGVLTMASRADPWSFGDAVDEVRRRIELGDVYQANVTDRFVGDFVGEPLELYGRLLAAQSCAFGAFVEMEARTIVSASPELFFRWRDDTVTCRPMKGTAARSADPDADAAAASALARSEKEQAENVMIVDLMRNDLGRLARVGSVRVPALFEVEAYETVWQLTSTVEAEVPASTDLVAILTALFPCGSVTGAPKVAATALIDLLEPEARGVYCGAIGLLSPPGQADRAVFSVPIRTAVLDVADRSLVYGAGAGITWSSDRDAETDEVVSKTAVLAAAHAEVSVLETLRLDEHGAGHLHAHLDRLLRTAEWLGVPFDRDAAERRVLALTPTHAAERLRLVLDRRGELTITREPIGHLPTPVRLAVDRAVTRSDDPMCRHKTTWRRHYDEARERWPGADDVVLVNERGRAIETTVANLAYRRAGRWCCPPLTDGGLPGIARAQALADGLLCERSIDAADLAVCDALAVINDLRGWRPARLVDPPSA